MRDTDGKKNAEPSQNGTADDISDLRRMIQGFGDNFIKLNDDLKQLQQKNGHWFPTATTKNGHWFPTVVW